MRIPRIFSDQDLVEGQSVQLGEFASGHICRVLRMKEGRPLVLFNGKGGEYSATLVDADAKRAKVDILGFDPVDRESPLRIHLGLALSRADRFDWALQKSVELGVAEITPLLCLRSESVGDAKRQSRKLAHWHNLILSACEQSGRTALPSISEPCSIKNWAEQTSGATGFLLDPGGRAIGEFLGNAKSTADKSIRFAIGAEGGFDPTEQQLFVDQNFHAVSFGPRILRTETAPVAVITLFQYLLGDMN